MAAEGQNATLEFILVNHPLDCPVCDKGGECPLQDLTFRYGPGLDADDVLEADVRQADPDLADDRARPRALHPLLPLHALLRVACPRTASSWRGTAARSRVIATFEDRPYRAPFSGNVIELCPVGALTSTQYRFEGRPWEIQNVPTVCGLCPVGCNIAATTREGKVKRILSRNHPEVDEGWLCDKGRFALPGAARRRPRDRAAPAHAAAGGSTRSRGTRRSTRSSGSRARPATAIVLALLGRRDGRGRVRAVAASCARASARTRSCCPRRRARRSTRTGSRSRRSATRTRSSSSATTPSSSARRSSTSGSAPRAGTARRSSRSARPATCRRRRARTRGSSRRSRRSSGDAKRVASSGRGPAARAAPSRPRWPRRSARRVRRRLPPARDAERPRRRASLGTRPATARRSKLERIGLLIVSGDEIARDAAHRASSPAGRTPSSQSAMFADELRAVRRPRPARRRATSSATGRWSTSRAASSASAAP